MRKKQSRRGYFTPELDETIRDYHKRRVKALGLDPKNFTLAAAQRELAQEFKGMFRQKKERKGFVI